MRYTALLGGVFYGIAHRRSLQKAHDADVKHHAIHEREHLIEEAKEAWKRKKESGKDGGESMLRLHVTSAQDPIPYLRLPPRWLHAWATHFYVSTAHSCHPVFLFCSDH